MSGQKEIITEISMTCQDCCCYGLEEFAGYDSEHNGMVQISLHLGVCSKIVLIDVE